MKRAVLLLLFHSTLLASVAVPPPAWAQDQDQVQTQGQDPAQDRDHEHDEDQNQDEVQDEDQIQVQAPDRPGNTELGFIVGEPTGISAKFWTSDNTAFDLGFAWSFSGQGSMHIHSNYLIHRYMQDPEIALYFGLGGRLLLEDDFSMGVRIPLGMQYVIPDSDLGLFFELAPLLQLVPGLDADINGGLGLRYFF